MANIPNKIKDRLIWSLKKFQPILLSAKSRDVGESDTVIIVTDMLADLFGYDKYSEITSEVAIKNSYCDLAIKIDGKYSIIIEVKAIEIELKDSAVKQAVDYAANQGVDWAILTNGLVWKIFKISFGKPIDKDLIAEIDMLSVNFKSKECLELLYCLTKEGYLRSSLYEYHSQRQALSRYFLASLILTDGIIDVMRKELRKISPDVKIDSEQIKNVLYNEVLKREVVEGEKAEEARKKIIKVYNKIQKNKIRNGTGYPSNSLEISQQIVEERVLKISE